MYIISWKSIIFNKSVKNIIKKKKNVPKLIIYNLNIFN